MLFSPLPHTWAPHLSLLLSLDLAWWLGAEPPWFPRCRQEAAGRVWCAGHRGPVCLAVHNEGTWHDNHLWSCFPEVLLSPATLSHSFPEGLHLLMQDSFIFCWGPELLTVSKRNHSPPSAQNPPALLKNLNSFIEV